MVPILIGHARVSTLDQPRDPQTDAVNRVGCEPIGAPIRPAGGFPGGRLDSTGIAFRP
jgi:hypothetical protein